MKNVTVTFYQNMVYVLFNHPSVPAIELIVASVQKQNLGWIAPSQTVLYVSTQKLLKEHFFLSSFILKTVSARMNTQLVDDFFPFKW